MRKQRYIVDPKTGCWNWKSRFSDNAVTVRPMTSVKGKHIPAYRLLFQEEYGAVLPSWVFCCHSCDNHSCVNPEHIFLGEQKENISDMISKGRAAWQTPNEKHSFKRTANGLKIRLPNKTGFHGVRHVKNRFMAHVTYRGKCIYIGCYKTPQEASAAYELKRKELYDKAIKKTL